MAVQNLYTHLKTLRSACRTAQQNPQHNPYSITHKWLNLTEHTPGVGRYHEIVRKLSIPMDVLVVRNPHNRHEGLYVIGQEAQVSKYIALLIYIVDKIELLTSEYKRNHYNRHLHFSEAKSLFKAKCINIYIKALDGLLEEMCFDDEYTERARDRKDYLRNSNLKTKKPFDVQ